MNYIETNPQTLIDVSKIADYMNIGLIGLTILIFVILILCFLRGMLRGWKKGTYHFIFMMILFAVAIFTLDFATSKALTINISGIKDSFAFNVNGKELVVPVTNVGDTLRNGLIIVFRDGFGIKDNPDALYNYAVAVSVSTVKLVLVFVEALVILIFGNLLALILWHILFKFILPYPVRKRINLRWVSGIESLVVAVVTMSLLIAPLSSVVNTVSTNLNYESQPRGKMQDTLVLADKVLDTYNDSFFAKVFFSWAKPDGVHSLDYMLMDYLTKSKSGETTVSVLDEVSALSKIAGDAAELYFGNSFDDGIAWRSLLTSTTQITSIIQSVGDTELFKVAVPFAVKVAAGLDEVIDYIGQDTADYVISTEVNWEKELDIVCDLYTSAVESGGFDFISDEHSEAPVPLFDDPYAIIFNDTFHQKIGEISADIDKMALLDRVLAGFMYTYVVKNPEQAKDNDPKTLQLIDMMPLNEDGTVNLEKLVTYKWGDELMTIIDPLYAIHDDNPDSVKAITDLMMSRFKPKAGEEAPDDETFRNDLIDAVLAIVADSNDAVNEAIIGPRDADHNPVTDKDGKSEEDACLMDSALLTNAMNAIPDYLGATVAGLDNGIEGVDMTKSKEVLFADKTDAGIRKAFKKEIGSVLDVLGEVVKTEEGKALVKNYKEHPGVDFDPDGQFLGAHKNIIKGLQAGLRRMDESVLLKDIVPPLGKHYIENNDSVKNFGIEKIYLDNVDFGAELADVLEIVNRCPDVTRFGGTMSGNSSMDRIISALEGDDFRDQLSMAIDILGNCDIINPPEVHNEPIYNIVSKLIGESSGFDFQPEDFDIPDLFSTYDADWNRTSNGETYFMVEALGEVARSNIVNVLNKEGQTTSEMIHALSKIDLETLFKNIAGSSLLRKNIAKTLDEKVVEDMLKPSEINVNNVSYTNLNVGTKEEIVTRWENEGRALNAIVTLADRGINFNEIDIFGGDGANLMGVLKKFSASGIFRYINSENQEVYLFNEYFYNKLLMSLKGSELKYFVDQGKRPIAEAFTEDTPLENRQAITTTFHNNCTVLNQVSDWASDDAQLDIFSGIITKIGDLGGMDALSTIDTDSVPHLRSALTLLANSDVCGNVVIPNAMEDGIESIQSDDSDFDFSNANTPYLWNLNDLEKAEAKEKRLEEITYIMNVMEALFDTHYGVYKDKHLDMSKMNVSTISTDYFMRPVLANSKASRVLATRKDESKLSVFQLTIATFVKHSGIYGSGVTNITDPISSFDSNKYCSYSISELIENISELEWDDEIERLCIMMDRAKETVFIDPVNKNIDFNRLSDPKVFFNEDVNGKNEQDLRDLVSYLNQSNLFYRSLPFHLSSAFEDLNVLGDGEFANDIGWANAYFNVTYDAVNDKYDQDPYPQSDLDDLIDVLKTFGKKASGIDMNDITNIEANGVSELLSKMGSCNIFNSYNPYTAPTKDLTTYKQGLTSFQCVMADFLCTDAMEKFYFSASSPKDKAYVAAGHYSNLETKAAYEVKTLLPNKESGFGTEQIALINGDKSSLKAVLTSLTSPQLSDVVSSSGFEVGKLNYESFMLLLGELNECKLTQDMVPNAIASMVSGEDSAAYKPNLEGVKFDRGNYYFSYWWYEEDGHLVPHAEPDYSQKFYVPELEQIASICSFLMTNKSSIESLSEFKISKLDPYMMRDLLAELNASYVFHLAGPDTITRDTYEVNDMLKIVRVTPTGDSVEYLNPLSVFEQLMFKFYTDSKLADEAFNKAYDLPYFLNYGTYTVDAVEHYYGAKVKLYDSMQLFEQGLGSFSHTGDWLTEIEALTTDGRQHHGYSLDDSEYGLLETIKSLNSIMGGDTVNLDVNKFRKLSPAQIRWVLQGLNRVDLVCDALPNSTRSLITTNNEDDGLGIQKYTAYTKYFDYNVSPIHEWEVPGDGYYTATQRVSPRSIRFKYDGDPSEHFKIYVINDDSSELDVTKVTSAGTATAVAGYVKIDMRNVPSRFKVVCDDPAGQISEVYYEYDTANFRQSQASFETTDLNSVYYFLASAYRGKNSHPGDENNLYFSFDDGKGITEFLDEGRTTSLDKTVYQHSTYGLMNFFLTSNIYNQTFNDVGLLTDNTDDVVYTSGDYALYNLFKVEVEFNGNNVEVNIADNFGDGSTMVEHLMYLNTLRNSYYSTPMNVKHSLLEAGYLDNYIVGAGTVQAYIDSSKIALDPAQTPATDMGYLITNYALGYSQYDAAHNYMKDVMTNVYHNDVNGHYDDSISGCPDEFKISLDDPAVRESITGFTNPITEPGYIGKSILAGQVRDMQALNYTSINIENADRMAALKSPTHNEERNTFIPQTDVVDPYGMTIVSEQPHYSFTTLKSNLAQTMKMTEVLHLAFDGMATFTPSALDATQKEALASAVEEIGTPTGDDKYIADAFYLGSLYNALIYRLAFYSVTSPIVIKNDMIDMVNPTNFVRTDELPNYYDQNVAWSYAELARAIRHC